MDKCIYSLKDKKSASFDKTETFDTLKKNILSRAFRGELGTNDLDN